MSCGEALITEGDFAEYEWYIVVFTSCSEIEKERIHETGWQSPVPASGTYG